MNKNDLIARDQDKTPASMRPDAHREDEDDTVSDIAPEANGQDEPRDDHAPRPERAPKIGRAPGTGLKIYKPGQGYYVRVGTTVGAAILIAFGAYFLYDQVGAIQNQFVRFGVPLAFMVVSAAL